MLNTELVKTKLSYHAFKRVSERLSMSHRSLAKIIENDLVIYIGEETNKKRVHKLFYSKPDRMCFVAIQDVNDGTIITVLPIDYHQNISWRISFQSQLAAKKLIHKNKSVIQNTIVKAKKRVKKNNLFMFKNRLDAATAKPSVFKLSVTVTDEYAKHIKTISLGDWPCGPYNHSIETLTQDKEFIDYVLNLAGEQSIANKDDWQFIDKIIIKLGEEGCPVFYPIPYLPLAKCA